MRATKRKQSVLFLGILIAFMIILSACAAAPEVEEPAEPAAPVDEPMEPEPEPEEPAEEPAPVEEPFDPDMPSDQFPVQYGQDSRTELVQHPDLQLKQIATAVAVFVHKDQVTVSNQTVTLKGYTLNEMSESGWLVLETGAPMCPGERFSSQVAVGYCTGFLIKDDIIVTAGHCLDKNPCEDTSIIFGYQLEADGSLASLKKDNLYQCEEVLLQKSPSSNDQDIDFALIKLDRTTGKDGLSYSSISTVKNNTNVAVVGYPSGIPLKIASNSFVLHNDASAPYFVTNLDSFGSNSGSPVINTDTYQVEGILVRGMTDYVLSGDGTCIQVNRCPESGGDSCSGENVTKMEVLAKSIQENTTPNNKKYFCYPGHYEGFPNCNQDVTDK